MKLNDFSAVWILNSSIDFSSYITKRVSYNTNCFLFFFDKMALEINEWEAYTRKEGINNNGTRFKAKITMFHSLGEKWLFVLLKISYGVSVWNLNIDGRSERKLNYIYLMKEERTMSKTCSVNCLNFNWKRFDFNAICVDGTQCIFMCWFNIYI